MQSPVTGTKTAPAKTKKELAVARRKAHELALCEERRRKAHERRLSTTAPGLSAAQFIDNIQSVPYTAGIKGPKFMPNRSVDGFCYDREFLLQFMELCKDKPEDLPDLEFLGIAPSYYPVGYSGQKEQKHPTPSSGRMASSGQIPFPKPIVTAIAGPTDQSSPSLRKPRKKGKKHVKASDHSPAQSSASAAKVTRPHAAFAPLKMSANRWVPLSIRGEALPTGAQDFTEVMGRKVRGLLNKLTTRNFDSISDQVVTWINKPESKGNDRTLKRVVQLVHEQVAPQTAEPLACLCHKLAEQISPEVRNQDVVGIEGNSLGGGELFRKYLLNGCQERFDQAWTREFLPIDPTSPSTRDTSNQFKRTIMEDVNTTSVIPSHASYASEKAEDGQFGLVRFIGELFRLQMVTERIMHECIKKLLSSGDSPRNEGIEPLCMLLTAIGQPLDTPGAKRHMDVYITRIKELTKGPNVACRLQSMLQDVIELRERKWVPRNAMIVPTTIAAVRESGAKEKDAAKKDVNQRSSAWRKKKNRRNKQGTAIDNAAPPVAFSP